MISPVEIFRPGAADGTQQILSGGLTNLASILRDSVAIGRDMANLQATQGKEFLDERERAVNTEIRRGEILRTQKNTDRAFLEDVLRDRRDAKLTETRDARNFDYRKEQDAKELALESFRVGNSVADREEDNRLRREELQLKREELDEVKSYKRTRAADLLRDEPTWLEKLFGTGNASPQGKIDRGRQLKALGDAVRDPEVAARGDELFNEGYTEINEGRAGRSTRKAKQTPQERMAFLEREVASLQSVQTQIKKDDPYKDLTETNRVKLESYLTELQALKAKLGGGSPAKSTDPLAKDIDWYFLK